MTLRHTWAPQPTEGASARSKCTRCGVLRRVRFSSDAGYIREWAAAPEGPWNTTELVCSEPKGQER